MDGTLFYELLKSIYGFSSTSDISSSGQGPPIWRRVVEPARLLITFCRLNMERMRPQAEQPSTETSLELPEPTREERALIATLRDEIRQLEESSIQDAFRKQRNYVKRKLALLNARLKALERGDFGRRIPDAVSSAVIERDGKRDFGRPNHACEGVRPPHHIKHFETFKGSHTRENPHSEENLEAPCQDCHKLAHALRVPSGTSIEKLFRSFGPAQWKMIEEHWSAKRISELEKIGQERSASKRPAFV